MTTKVAAVARVAAMEAARSRLLVVVVVTIAVALGALAWASTGDGSAVGRVRAFLSWGAGWVELVLSLLTVFLSTTLAQALRDGRLVPFTAGPLPRGLLPLGWWAGVALVLALLVALAHLLLWGLARVMVRAAPPADRPAAALVLSSRGVARPPRPDPRPAAAAAARQAAALEQAGELADLTDAQREQVLEWLERAARERTRAVARGRAMAWTLDGVDPDRAADRVWLRFQYTVRDGTGQQAAAAPRGRFSVVPEGAAGVQLEGRWRGGAPHELAIPTWALEGRSRVQVVYENRADEAAAVVFPEVGVELLYPAGTFGGNVTRAGLVLLGRLLILAAVGVAAASLIDGKLAALVVLFVLTVGAGREFLLDSLEAFTGFGAASPVLVNLLRGVLLLLPDLASCDAAALLSSAERIATAEVLRSLGLDGLLRALGVLALAAVAFGRRELGAIR
ncbi:MAG: hypothetical protein M9894_15830 [Planctomycetes bacterium]|nr:hypothetical protein [Planctomycetota bacterium]